MKRIIRVMAAALLVPALSLAATAAKQRPSKRYTVEQFMATIGIGGASFSPDESKILFSSNETGIFNAYTVPVTGGKPTRLTDSTKEAIQTVGYFPKDGRILLSFDQGGNENNHLYVRTPDGAMKDITPGPKLKAQFMGWTFDDKGFYAATNERDAKFFDIYRYNADDYSRTLLYKDETGYQFNDISRDGKWIAFSKPTTTNDNNLYLYSVADGKMKHLTPHTGDVSYSAEAFDPASKYLYILSNQGNEFARVQRYELATGNVSEVEKADWDVMYTYFSRNGTYRVTAVNADGTTQVHIVEAKSGKPVALPKLPDGDIRGVAFSRSEKKMVFSVNGDRSPSNLYVYDFVTKKTTKLTSSLSPDIDPDDLAEAEVVRFKSFDGMTIPSIFYKPLDASPDHKVPAMIWVHGGPGGQTRRGYSSFIQYLVNHGYAVLGINNRGSSGYGKTYYAADDQKHGHEPLQDCVEAKKYLASLPYIDGSKIGIIGGSYGGYMVLAGLAFQPDTFDVGVDLFGVSNWLRTIKSIPPYWESFRKALYAEMGDPVKDEQMLKDISPLFHADQIRRPLLVFQGENDPRVIKPESDEIVAAVKKNGVPVEYVVFPEEGHGFAKKANNATTMSTTLTFLDKYLKNKEVAK
ncbi:MAG TPA: S9 family peptidase [Thermoanaerobaculia bacterium]|jgi:dipeptidyl aminopeptidase/acylaminoacyl peptidase